MFKSSVNFRLAIINVIALAALAFAVVKGLLPAIYNADPYFFCTAIFGVFLLGMLRVNALRSYLAAVATITVPINLEIYEARTAEKMEAVDHYQTWLVILGLLGTVIGFIIGLVGIDPAALKDASRMTEVFRAMTLGVGMALFKTATGFVCWLWMTANMRILRAEAAKIGIDALVRRSTGTA